MSLIRSSKLFRPLATTVILRRNIGTTVKLLDPSNYVSSENYQRRLERDCEFWAQQAEKLRWFKRWDKVLDNSNPPFSRWFVGGEMNTCYNAVDRHIEDGYSDQVAIYYDSPLTNTKRAYTYKEVLKEVNQLAGALREQGVRKGDVVLVYMPMIPQAIFAMLASARIGAVHSLVFGGFAALQLAARITHAKPKVIVTSTFGAEPNREIAYLPIVRNALKIANFSPNSIIVYSRPPISERNYSTDFAHLTLDGHHVVNYGYAVKSHADKAVDPVPVPATDPIYILYTSGTTGTPKAPVRPSGGHAVSLYWSMNDIYGVEPGEPFGAMSDLGWVVGHSYICYGPMLHRNPTLLYEGKPVHTPDAGAVFRLIDEYKLVCLFASPTALRAVKRLDPEGEKAAPYDISSLRHLFLAGEHLDSATLLWARERFRGRPVIDHWWQTETGWPMAATRLGPNCAHELPPLSSCGRPTPGWNVEVIGKDFKKCEPNEMGTIVARLPLPPGSLSTLYKSDERFIEAYFKKFPGYYDTTDAGYMDKFGNVFVMGRIDDVINVAGHRLSTGSLEEAIQLVDEIAEAAVVGREDHLKGHVPFAFCTLKEVKEETHLLPGHTILEDEQRAIAKVRASVRKHVGAIATLTGGVVIIKRMPKTRSGKIARNTLAAMVNKKPFEIPVTIETPQVYDEIAEVLKTKMNIDCILPGQKTVEVDKQCIESTPSHQ